MSLRGYWESVTGMTNAGYDDDNRYGFGFTSDFFQIHYKSGTNPIYYSFNGSEDHGILDNAVGSIQTQILDSFRANEVWLKGGSGDEIIEITAHPKH